MEEITLYTHLLAMDLIHLKLPRQLCCKCVHRHCVVDSCDVVVVRGMRERRLQGMTLPKWEKSDLVASTRKEFENI